MNIKNLENRLQNKIDEYSKVVYSADSILERKLRKQNIRLKLIEFLMYEYIDFLRENNEIPNDENQSFILIGREYIDENFGR